MSKMQEWTARIRTFVDEVRTELKKCAWPTRPELFDSTVVVIVSVLLVGVFVGASDIVLQGVLRLVIR